MAQDQIQISDSFRKSAFRAVGGILFFILTYLVLIALSLAFLGLCLYGGLGVIMLRPSFFTLMIGLGLIAMGVLVVIFLFKFLFHRHKSDLSHLTEVTREQEPALFALIDDLTVKVGTSAPRRVFLSSAVNASVFYDSSFWSMFLPVKKNLEVGMGLVNSVTVNELRAVLAHEFGHFSQRSMKVGSYVYFVNRVIFNMLYENEGYAGVANSVARVNSYLNFFTRVAIRIVHGIQWVLRKVYGVVNLSYLKLSREMEFHADEVAARTTGSAPLVDSLLRLDLASKSFDTVTEFYQGKVNDAIRADNLFRQQFTVLQRLSEDGDFATENGLPKVMPGQESRFNRSRLVIANQWASHPSTEDRVSRLATLAIPEAYQDHALARSVFRYADATERMLTDKYFSKLASEKDVTTWDERKFAEVYDEQQEDAYLPKIFRGYYDIHNPIPFDLKEVRDAHLLWQGNAPDLFDDNAVNRIYERNSLASDLHVVSMIGQGNTTVRQFEYDGEKYAVKDCASLSERMIQRLESLKSSIADHDKLIYSYFHGQAEKSGQQGALDHAYAEYFRVDKLVDELDAERTELVSAMAFLNESTTLNQIEANLEDARPKEQVFKDRLARILTGADFQAHITPELREDFQRFIDNRAAYFIRPDYQQHVLDLFYKVVNGHRRLMWLLYREKKLAVLRMQEDMMGM